jgi:predicted Zn-dependent protease
MGSRFFLFLISILIPSTFLFAVEERIQEQDYLQSALLLKEALKKQPDNQALVFRLADVTFLTGSRSEAIGILIRFLESNRTRLSPEKKAATIQKAYELATRFKTEEGQSFFFKAELTAQRGDYLNALDLIRHSNQYEPNHFLPVKRQAQYERALGRTDAYYFSLKQAYQIFPRDFEVNWQLVEQSLSKKEWAQAESIINSDGFSFPKSVDGKLVRAFLDVELKKYPEALSLLESYYPLSENEKIPLLLPFFIGKALVKSEKEEGVKYIKQFLKRMTQFQGPYPWDPFDPFSRMTEAVELASFRKKTSRLE